MTVRATAVATFVLCIENNGIREQALLLVESIRRWAGALRDAPIIAVAPRAGLGVDGPTRHRLDAMGVRYVEASLNRACPEYGSANRVFAAAWAEAHAQSEWVIVLDSDTVFLREPELPDDVDVAVRPVDTKGSATEGPGDPFEDYWQRLAVLGRVSLDALPFVATTDGCHRVRASYNGGLIVVRRGLGILSAWAELFGRSVAAGLRPWKGSNLNVHASMGPVGIDASEYWGSNQAAAALAIWARTRRVGTYPETYNIPLHLHLDRPQLQPGRFQESPVHVHYHWAFARLHASRAVERLRELGVDEDRLAWLNERLPLE